MSTQATAVQLLVQTQQMSDPMTSYGKSLVFDFSKLPNGQPVPDGQQILAYSVALSGFQAQYATQSNSSDEQVQQFAVGLVPNLVGSQVIVTSNVVLADYDGDAASETQDVDGRESYAIVTVIAIIGTTPTNDWTVTNVFWLSSGADSVNNIPSFTNNMACSGQYVAGFDFLYTGNTKHEINGFKLSTSSNTGDTNTDVVLSGAVTMSTDSKYDGGGTVSLGFLAFENPSEGVTLGVDIVTPTFSWDDPDDSNGITGSFTADIDVPPNYQISQAAFLLSYIYLDFKDYHDLGIIAAGVTDTTINIDNTNNQVSGSLIMNLYSDEGISKYSIQKDSSMNGLVLVTFEPAS
jgi:hypothetical protein